MMELLVDYMDAFRRKNNPTAKDNWSPSFKHQFGLIGTLMSSTPRHQWPEAIQGIKDAGYRKCTYDWYQAMERDFPSESSTVDNAEPEGARTRLSRNAKNPPASVESRRSKRISDIPSNPYVDTDNDEEDEDEDMSMDDFEDSHSPDQTYNREFVDAHPDEQFYHTGNGWYKRGSRSNESSKPSSDRRDSTASRTAKTSVNDPFRDSTTVKREQLHLFPGLTFHHKGNGWYKQGMAPDGRRGSILISAEGNIIKRDDVLDDDSHMSKDDLLLLDENATVTKEFTLKYPHIDWIHRGQGRWKRKSAVLGNNTPVASSERRSSRADNSSNRDYAESFTSADFRRTSDRRRSSKTFADMPSQESEELAYKADTSPDEKSRAQGRGARGPKSSMQSIPADDEAGADGLVSTSYVEKHPNETFHHRGQGKWARGMPPPDASNKTAIRGPGAQAKATPVKTGEENEAGEKPPPLNALLRREEGPNRWPHLHWVYRGGGKWCRQTKEESQRMANPSTAAKPAKPATGRARGDGPGAQLQRETLAAEDTMEGRANKVPAYLQRPAKFVRKRSDMSAAVGEGGMRSKASSNSHSKAPTPRPPLLPPEEDQVTEEDLPTLFKEDWSSPEEDELDEPDKIIRRTFDPLVGADPFVKALTKHDPAVRSLDSLKQIAGNAQAALKALQDEYLQLDVVVAQHPMNGKKERKPVKGGRQAVEHDVWEDKKEAMLYDYNFDARKIGYQDPDGQRIQRDDEGRELRRRRRNDPHATAVDYGDGEMTTRRRIKPVSRFDGVVVPPPRKRSRLTANNDDTASQAADPSPIHTPERVATPVNAIEPPSRGRKDFFPKRIRELRGESVGSTRSDASNSNSPKPAAGPASAASTSTSGGAVRKGRPPGSKNQHKRKDAGIKKGPRKPKPSTSGAAGAETPGSTGSAEPMEGVVIPAIIENPPDDVPAAAAPDAPMGLDEAVTRAFSLAARA